MTIITGLGNPGRQYENTRHNLGFLFLDYICTRVNSTEPYIHHNNFFYKRISVFDSDNVILIKPDTFMNLSGLAVKSASDYFNTAIEDFIVCFDDLAIPAGQIRLRSKGSDGGHNGLKSIIAEMGNEKFKRIRFGIMPGSAIMAETSDYVLSRFSEEEIDKHLDSFEKGYDALECILKNDMEKAMQIFNKKFNGGNEPSGH